MLVVQGLLLATVGLLSCGAAREIKQTCTPEEIFNDGCYICICNKDGKSSNCAHFFCGDREPFVNKHPKYGRYKAQSTAPDDEIEQVADRDLDTTEPEDDEGEDKATEGVTDLTTTMIPSPARRDETHKDLAPKRRGETEAPVLGTATLETDPDTALTEPPDNTVGRKRSEISSRMEGNKDACNDAVEKEKIKLIKLQISQTKMEGEERFRQLKTEGDLKEQLLKLEFEEKTQALKQHKVGKHL